MRNRTFCRALTSIVFTLLLALPLALRAQGTPIPGQIPVDSWPRTVTSGGDTLTIYEPQVESWQGNALVKQVKIYPLSKAANPPAQRLLDMTDIMYNGLVGYDETFFTSLSRALNEETVQPRDLQMMGMLLPLGIEKGKEFKPGAATVPLLKAAAREAHAWLMNKAATDMTPWWTDSQWGVPSPPITMPTEFKWEVANYFDVDSRAIALSQYFAPTAKLGTGSFYFGTFHDSKGNPLQGGSAYRLHVPANVPVREFWSVTVYSLETSSFFSELDAPHARFPRQGSAQERRRLGRHLLRTQAARRSGFQLAVHPGRSEVVPVVPRVWP